MKQKYKLDILLWGVIIIGLLGFVLVASVNASERHRTPVVVNVPDTGEDGDGTALALSQAQLNFDWHTTKWQASVGAGYYDNLEAVSVGIGKKFGDVLVNGSIGCESKCGGGIGATFRF